MYRSITIIYIILYGCFVLFARQPDYFDGEVANATIHLAKDAASSAIKPTANFLIGANKYIVAASYPLRSVNEGDVVSVIYESANPKKAVVYSIWGYWILWDELLVSSVIYLILFQVAVGITSNPTPEALLEQLEYKPKPKTRYTD
jgi:hypothetical protein